MSQDSAFSHYTQLIDKVDQIFVATRTRYSAAFQCQSGCYGCCKSGLSVTNIEAARIIDWLRNHPDVLNKLKTGRELLDDAGYCEFLSRDGGCLIYEVRPLICRSHGMPIAVFEEGQELRDCCPLNFQNVDLNQIDRADVLSLDKVNTLLSLIDRSYDPLKAGDRVLLDDLLVQMESG
jgi:Fe-S-cluster containining protein